MRSDNLVWSQPRECQSPNAVGRGHRRPLCSHRLESRPLTPICESVRLGLASHLLHTADGLATGQQNRYAEFRPQENC